MIPDATFALVRQVMERPDFAALEWDPGARLWWVGLFNGNGEHADGKKKITWYRGGRLTPVLELAAAQHPAHGERVKEGT